MRHLSWLDDHLHVQPEPPTARARHNVATIGLFRIAVFVALLEARILFAYLRALVDNAGFPHERNVLPAIDRFIGLGEMPGQRLQSVFFPGHLTGFDQFWLGIYESWFIVPTVLTGYILIFRWDLIGSYAPMRLLAYFLPLPIYLFMPSDPPWMLVHGLRIASLTSNGIPFDSNPYAAFPSMHVLTPAAIAVWLWWKRLDVMAMVFSVYTAMTVFAVLYLGEHYLVDVLASLALAPLLLVITARIERLLPAKLASAHVPAVLREAFAEGA